MRAGLNCACEPYVTAVIRDRVVTRRFRACPGRGPVFPARAAVGWRVGELVGGATARQESALQEHRLRAPDFVGAPDFPGARSLRSGARAKNRFDRIGRIERISRRAPRFDQIVARSVASLIDVRITMMRTSICGVAIGAGSSLSTRSNQSDPLNPPNPVDPGFDPSAPLNPVEPAVRNTGES